MKTMATAASSAWYAAYIAEFVASAKRNDGSPAAVLAAALLPIMFPGLASQADINPGRETIEGAKSHATAPH